MLKIFKINLKGKVITFKNYTPLVSEMHQTIKREKNGPIVFKEKMKILDC